MPIIEFRCPKGHITEKLYLTFAEAEEVECVACRPCALLAHVSRHGDFQPLAQRIISVPGKTLFLGDGWTQPGALGGKPTTKGADPSKRAQETVQEMGGKNIARAIRGAR